MPADRCLSDMDSRPKLEPRDGRGEVGFTAGVAGEAEEMLRVGMEDEEDERDGDRELISGHIMERDRERQRV